MTKIQKRGKTMDTSKSYLSKVVKEMPDSGIKDFFDIANTMEGALSLGVGEPDFPTPEHVREAAIASIKRGETKYTDNRGTVELRAAAAEYLEKFGLHYDRENEILITMGASEGIDLALRALVDPGDEVLVVEPCYVSYIPCVELCGGIPVSIPLKAENKFRLTKEELEEKIKVLEKDKQNVLERETNTRAGYVYIISNIGSFGKDVYKIGMTRRLEPMDRISELSSASVPFPFDVHALIFSEDAPALENTLHKYFKKQEVNKVNQRKEFFKVNLEEIKELVHKEYNNTVHFTDLAAAEQYFESLKIEQQETAS